MVSKAYDRVNIHMLRKAMTRLKLPDNFTSLITNLFINRKNSVFTAVGTTEPYDMLVGIDQGEIISPLLWCIYYDPLLCEIQSHNLGYEITSRIKEDVYSDLEKTKTLRFPGLAYMDDTNWISGSIVDLENILEIADDFYKLNDIQINKEKSELMLKTYRKKFDYKKQVYINYGPDIINLTPKHPMNLHEF